MKREEQIIKYCEEMGFPLGSCSSINSIKAQTAVDAIRWADENRPVDWQQVRIQAAMSAMQGKGYSFVVKQEALMNHLHVIQ